MKIAIPTKNNQVDNHFGHCEYFTLLTIEGNEIKNTEKLDSGDSCGCKSNIVGTLKEKGVNTLLAGQMGQGAINKITNAGIEVVRGCEGDINVLVKEYLAGNIKDQFIVCPPHDHEHGHECNHN